MSKISKYRFGGEWTGWDFGVREKIRKYHIWILGVEGARYGGRIVGLSGE